MTCKSCVYLKNKSLTIVETPYWKADLSKDQSYLGHTTIDLKRHCPKLSELTNEEQLDFLNMIKKIDKMLTKTFDCDALNISCLMNHSLKEIPKNPHVHYQIIPRYEHPKKFKGINFLDEEFGKHYDPKKKFQVEEKILYEMLNEIKKEL